MLKQRIITGAILAALFIGSILYGDRLWPYWVNAFFALILFFAAREMMALTLRTSLVPSALGALVFALLFWWAQPRIPLHTLYWQAFGGLAAWLVIAAFLPFYRRSGRWPLALRGPLSVVGLGLLWISVHCLMLLYSRFDQGQWLLLYLLSLVWVADIGAYFSGRRFGKTRLAPAISPGKTWEGVFGGVAANLLWTNAVFHAGMHWGLSWGHFIAISLAAAVLSIAGDLYVSVLKREAGVKDSSRLLPGHGGMLDRIDSVLAASPVFVSGLYLAVSA